MLSFYQKRSFMSWLYSPISIVILLLICILLAKSVYERYTIERDMSARRAVAEGEVQALKDRKDALEERVEYLSNERGIEAEMRRNFDIARPGEQVIIILDNEETKDTSLQFASSTPREEEKPWYKFW